MRYLTKLSLWLLLVSGLGPGCAVGPDYRKAEPDAPGRWSRLDETPGLASADDPGDLSRWWHRLDDPMLDALVEEALRASPDLRMARARLREARARRAMAGAAQLPSLSASGSASRRQSIVHTGSGQTSNSFTAGFDASWEIDVFGGVRRSVEASEADRASSEAGLHDARITLVAEVARSYFEVRCLQIRLRISRRNLESQTETLALTEFRAKAGLVSSQDVEQATSNREQTRAQIPSLETGLAEAEHRLDVLLGKAPGALHARLAAGGELPAMPDRIAVGIPADALRQRPDVRAAERKLAAETARIGVAEAALYPSFSLSGSIGLDAAVQGALGNGAGLVYSLLGGITAPLFQGGRLRAQVEAQDAVCEQALVAYEQAVLTALQDVENALVALARHREREEALTRAAGAARNAAELARQRYGAGVIDFQSVLDTERSVLSLEDSLASTRADGVLALIRLYKALGGGWSPQAEARPAGEDAP
ncbi:MAG: efflux transporter outer membrane subunit [Deltaproteobacteria bacterium]|nr:efflux transporter outer membrane subunit [Deltaproteobacteria bacterium]